LTMKKTTTRMTTMATRMPMMMGTSMLLLISVSEEYTCKINQIQSSQIAFHQKPIRMLYQDE
jgi:hypothetical protein